MTNFIKTDLAGVDILLQGSKELNENFKTIQQSKSSKEPHLKYLSTEFKAIKKFAMRHMGSEK
jgi:hypothetical protein